MRVTTLAMREQKNQLLPDWLRFLNLGVEDSLPFAEKVRRYITTGCSAALAVAGFGFALANALDDRLFLVAHNLIAGFSGLAGLALVWTGSPRLAFGTVTLFAGLSFFQSAVRFNNGTEFYLVTGIVACMFMFDNRFSRWSLSLLLGVLFTLAKLVLLADGTVVSAISPGHYALNLWIFLLGVMVFLEVYRVVNRNYRKRLEEQQEKLERQRGELETANRAKERLFAILGHDLRGPVGNVRSVLDLLRHGELSDEEVAELRDSLADETTNLEEMLENLLAWAAGQMDRIEPRPDRFSLREKVAEVFAAQSVAAARKDVRLINEVPADLHPFADPAQVQTVLRNLVSNGVKFTLGGGLVRVSAEAVGERAEVTVEDSGVGMDPGRIASLGRGEIQTSSRGTDREKGFGIGLRICDEFVRANGGELSVGRSERAGGTAVSFGLPAKGRST